MRQITAFIVTYGHMGYFITWNACHATDIPRYRCFGLSGIHLPEVRKTEKKEDS